MKNPESVLKQPGLPKTVSILSRNLFKECKPHGLTVGIEPPDTIFNAAQKGKLILLEESLEGPIKNIGVVLESKEKDFSVKAKLVIGNIKIGNLNTLSAPVMIFPKLEHSFPDAELFLEPEGGHEGIMLTGKRGTKMFISAEHQSHDVNEINISTGTPGLPGKIQKLTPALPKTLENMEAALLDMSAILEITMENIYPLIKEEVPDKKLVLGASLQKKSLRMC